MLGNASLKVEGGKLLCVDILYNEQIQHVSITGDFFIHPEEVLEDIEDALMGISAKENEERITSRIREVIAGKKAEMIGINPEAIARAVREAIN